MTDFLAHWLLSGLNSYARAAFNELCGIDGVGCTMHHFRVFCESTELPAIISIINSVGDGANGSISNRFLLTLRRS